MQFGSVCSGIEAASVAWEPLGWRAAWFAEVDKAASQVLAYRFPDVPNHGDMTKLAAKVRAREIPAPDVLVGGTPCQSFSVAGMRGGLADPRGQLTIAFIELADAIDEVRLEDGLDPVIIVWENVPGVFTHADNPFGCFLAGIAGDDEPVEPGPRPDAGKSSPHWNWSNKEKRHVPKWTNAGAAVGPSRAVAWRVLDAQWFGLAQRRRRVFLVASARAGFDPAAILLEFDGVRRDSAPSREAGEGITHPIAPCLTSSGRGVERTGDPRGQDAVVDDSDDCGGFRQPDGSVGFAVDICPTLRAGGNQTAGDRPPGTDVDTADSLIVAPVPTWWDGRDVSQTLDAVLHKGQTMPEKNRFPAVLQPVCYAFQPRIARNGRGDMGEIVSALTAQAGETGKGDAAPHVAYDVLPFDTTQITSPSNYSVPKAGDPCHPLAAGAHPPAVCVTEPVTHTLKADGFDASEDGTGRGQPIVPALYSIMPMNSGKDFKAREVDVAQPLMAGGPVTGNQGGDYALQPPQMAVRRLMPVECERLQGFPDNWTLVPTGPKGKMTADGPRYKQCGNSMATTVMNWVGSRIAAALPNRHNGGPAIVDSFDALMFDDDSFEALL